MEEEGGETEKVLLSEEGNSDSASNSQETTEKDQVPAPAATADKDDALSVEVEGSEGCQSSSSTAAAPSVVVIEEEEVVSATVTVSPSSKSNNLAEEGLHQKKKEEEEQEVETSAVSSGENYPRMPQILDRISLESLARRVLDLSIPSELLDVEDMDRVVGKKALSRLQVMEDLWLLDRLVLAMDSTLSDTTSSQTGRDVLHARNLMKGVMPKYPAPWWDATACEFLFRAMGENRIVRAGKKEVEKIQEAFPEHYRSQSWPSVTRFATFFRNVRCKERERGGEPSG